MIGLVEWNYREFKFANGRFFVNYTLYKFANMGYKLAGRVSNGSDGECNGADAGFFVNYRHSEFGNRGIKVADRKSKGSGGGILRNYMTLKFGMCEI